jgi:hypothetical protein
MSEVKMNQVKKIQKFANKYPQLILMALIGVAIASHFYNDIEGKSFCRIRQGAVDVMTVTEVSNDWVQIEYTELKKMVTAPSGYIVLTKNSLGMDKMYFKTDVLRRQNYKVTNCPWARK